MQETKLLYSIIDKGKLIEMLESFQSCVNIGIQLIDEEGNILFSKSSRIAFCNELEKCASKMESCRYQHLHASKQGTAFGDSYIFSCAANLNHITYPLVSKGIFMGAVLLGPFLMSQPDSVLILDIEKKYDIPLERLLELNDTAMEIPVLLPSQVTPISRLLSYLLQSLIADTRLQFISTQSRMEQQSRISESIQMYKQGGVIAEDAYPYEKEKELLLKVKTKNISEAKGILNDLLGYVLFTKGNDLKAIKARSMELSSLLSRVAIEEGASADRMLQLNKQFLLNIQDINTLDTICLKLQEIVETFANSMFYRESEHGHDVIKKAMLFIAQHYSSNITLQDVADYVHLNASYFSTIFKQYRGISFREHLNMVRIEEAKHLLRHTDYPVLNIALTIGFEDQSYFSKVFKRYTGLTPKQYRD